MIEVPIPANEAERLQVLASLAVMDTPPEARFDRITRFATELFEVPIAIVGLIDANRQWYKSCVGLDATEVPRSLTFCGHAIVSEHDVYVVEDAAHDNRFQDHPMVLGEPHVRFYAGVPLRVGPTGAAVGTLCLVSFDARGFSRREQRLLAALAEMVLYELENVQLAARERTLRELQQLRENLAHHVNHELRNPLAATRMALDMLAHLHANADATQRELILVARENAGHLQRMIDDLMEASRADSGKLSLQLVSVDLVDMLHRFALSQQPLVEAAGLDWVVSLVPDAFEMTVDPTRLWQVLGNLVGNAIKFTPKGGRISLSLQVEKDSVLIAVADTGVGMASEHLPHLFDRLYQTSNKVLRGEKGLGLGLHICQQLVQAHGGQLLVRSRMGEGSCFEIRLPVSRT